MKYVQHGTVAYTRLALGGLDGVLLTVEADTTDWQGEPATVDVQIYWPYTLSAPEPGDRLTISIEQETTNG